MSETILAIQLYAELLLNIKSLTLSGTIRSKATQETKATLTTDGSEICVRHEGHEATIRVPAKKLGSAKATLDVPANCTEPINARVQIEGDLSDLITLRDDHSGNISPWSAPSLCTESSVSCAACSAPLIRPRALAQWKDLPSEGWAEMMDFWHCHKPEIGRKPVDDNDLGALKGYGADNKLQAVKGTGLVDQSTFLVSPEDSLAIISDHTNAATDEQQQNNSPPLHCPSCTIPIGALDTLCSGHRLYKWRLAITSPSTSHPEPQTHPLEKWLATILLTTSEARGVRKFHLKPSSTQRSASNGSSNGFSAHPQDDAGLLLWLFTPDLYFCSANSGAEHVSNASRGLKVLHRRVAPADAAALDTASSCEELELPDGLEGELRAVLGRNTAMLPSAMRKYQDWEVSLLRRFAPADLRVAGEGEAGQEDEGGGTEGDGYTDEYLNQYL